MVELYGITGSERIWEGFSSISHANGISAATPTALAYGSTGASWGTLDATSCSGSSFDAFDAFHAAFYGDLRDAHVTVIDSPASTWCSFRLIAQAGKQCATEIESHCESCQEGGPSLTRVSRLGPCGDEERRQRKHQRPFGRSSGAWKGKGVLAGSRKRQTAVMVAVACVPSAVCDQMEGVHGTVPDVRGCIPDPDAGGHSEPSSHAEACGCCQEACGCSWNRRSHHCAIRGRNGRDRSQGRRGLAARRKRAKNCRRAQSGGQQLDDVVRISRSTRAQTEAAKERTIGIGTRRLTWCYCFAQYAAFWQARCCVTNAYQHQGLQATCDPHAALLHWSHTVLQEPSFMSPWEAIESAQDLAIEVGAWGPLHCEDFVLPSQRNKSKGKVKFDDTVLVLQGKSNSGEFHIQQTILNDLCHGPNPHVCPGGHHERSYRSVQQDSAASSSMGSSSATHFLDRRLTNEIPGYIHHLQHLWRDNLLRLPDGQAYVVRTWYLHHVHQRVWTVPRVLHLPANPTMWHSELLAAWRDNLHNDEVLNIAVVFPEVRALQGVLPAHADLLLTQGGPEQAGGLTTVFPPTADAHGSYTWATSLPRHVSGVDILTAVNADVMLQSHACDLFHGGVVIPTTTAPAHWMQNGHSFVAVFQDLQGSGVPLPDAAEPLGAATTVGATIVHPDSSLDDVEDQAEESSPIASSNFDEEDLKGLHVFGLMQPDHHCFVRWTTYTTILLDVLGVVGLHRDLAIGFHHVQVPLIDQHVEEEAIILQRVGDIPPGSPDQLVVVDIVFEEGNEPPATLPRRVWRLPRFLCRSTVLQHLQLATICDRDRPDASCLLFFNRAYWDPDDDAPREFTHGVYLRIIVLPPKDHSSASVVVPICEHDVPPSKRQRRSRSGSPNQRSTPTGSSLFQKSMKLSGTSSWGTRSNSATFPSLAFTNGHAAAQVARDGHALPPLNANWSTPLRKTFYDCAVVEFQDEGPVQYWTTWFLHHTRYPRNSESRVLRLDRLRQHWYHDLRNLWGDVIDQSSAAWVHLVLPNPPGDTQQQTVGHLLLVQGHGPDIPTLLTAVFDHPVHRRIWHVAAFLPQYADRNDPIDILGVRRFCSSRTCYFQAGDAQWAPQEVAILHPGDSVLVTISPLLPAGDVDATSLMQVSRTSVDSSASGDPVSAVDVHPPPQTIPRTMPRRLERFWHQQLTEAFERHATTEMEEEGPVLYVWTWFINHQTSRTCREPIAVRLTAPPDQWWADLLEPWNAVLQPDALTHVNIVSPWPWNDRFRIDTIHMMIEQYPCEPVVASIVTTFLHGQQGDRIHQMAYSLPRWLCTQDLIDLSPSDQPSL